MTSISWSSTTLGNVLKPRKDKAIPSSIPGTPFIGMEHVQSHEGKLNTNGVSDDYRSLAPKVQKGDVLYGRLRPYLNKVVIAPFDAFASGEFIVIPPTDAVDAKFLLYRLLSLDFVNFTATLDTGDRPRVSWEQISKFEIDLPPVEEQHQIVEVLEDHLSRLDAALADIKQTKMKATQFRRSLLQAALNGMFGDNEINLATKLPRDWQWLTLDDVARWGSGGTPKSSDKSLYGGKIPWIVIGDLTEGLVNETTQTINQKGLDSSSAKLMPPGTVMVAMYGASIGRTGVMAKAMTTNQAIACGIVNESIITKEYLLYYLQSQKQNFIYAGKGGAQPNISQGVIKNWKIPVPPIGEQVKIIQKIEEQLSHLEHSSKVTTEIELSSKSFRRSLLQAAFTGQLTREAPYV